MNGQVLPLVAVVRGKCYTDSMDDHDILSRERRLLVKRNPADQRLPVRQTGVDLDGQEIVTAMTIGDYPEDLAVGYLLNQGMLRQHDTITGIDYDEELSVVVVRTPHTTNYEEKLRKKTKTSDCAQGTAFGDLMDVIGGIRPPGCELRTSCSVGSSVYLEAGAMHGAILLA